MVDEEGFKELPSSEFLQVAEATWLVLNVSSHSGTAVQAAGVTKIARSVITPLAEHHVSVLMLSTYQTDFILVREQDLSVVIHTLAQEFDIYREVGGEPVPVVRDESSNGFPRAQHGPSPTVHPIQSPQNRFCVLTVDPERLPAIATTLIDVLFYSHSAPKEAASGSSESSCIPFFAFSLIEGYISIVMDAETQKKFPSDLLLTSSSGELWRMMSVGSWPRSPAPWRPLTSLPTTSAPSTSTTPWCLRMASAVSSRLSSDGRRAWPPEALTVSLRPWASGDFSKLFPQALG
ncbi:cytosolic arginine sensor for mTORC1 subunit 1 isoform X2 [Tupaia chinensis]|nr:cytosolic arginine sensor for mTORC1 subunit 1 isoform X2 [Tupaia chinensis]